MKKIILCLVALVFLASPLWAADYLACNPYPYPPDTRIPGSFIVNVDGVDQLPTLYKTQLVGTINYAIAFDTTPLAPGPHTFTLRACLGANGMDTTTYGALGGCSPASPSFAWSKPFIVPASPTGSTVITIIVTPPK